MITAVSSLLLALFAMLRMPSLVVQAVVLCELLTLGSSDGTRKECLSLVDLDKSNCNKEP